MVVKRDPRGRFVKVKGLAAVSAKVQQIIDDLRGVEAKNAMREATLLVTRDAKILSPVDTGRLRMSILPSVIVKKFVRVVQGVVGSPVEYAPEQEKRVGFLRKALEKNVPRIKELIGRFVARLVSK